jgi:hypothetical protein
MPSSWQPLLRAVQPGEAGGEGIGDAEFHFGPEPPAAYSTTFASWIRTRPGSTIHSAHSGDCASRIAGSSRVRSRRLIGQGVLGLGQDRDFELRGQFGGAVGLPTPARPSSKNPTFAPESS